jgi:hypothetical protein
MPYNIARMDESKEMATAPGPRDELLFALGSVVFEFGLLDEALHDALYQVTDRREETRVLTSGLRFPELVVRFEALYVGFASAASGTSGVAELCKALNRLNEQRNKELHAVWHFWAESDSPLRTQHRLKKGAMTLSIQSVEPAELRELAREMAAAAGKVWEVALDYERQRRSARHELMLKDALE